MAVFEDGNDFSGVVIDLAFGQSAFAALESDSNGKRIFSRGNVFAAKKVDGLNGMEFRELQRTNRVGNFRKRNPFGEQQREITFDRREARQRLITARIFSGSNRGVERIEFKFSEKNFLAKFESFRDAARKLARSANRR